MEDNRDLNRIATALEALVRLEALRLQLATEHRADEDPTRPFMERVRLVLTHADIEELSIR